MEIHGREIKFRRTVGATCRIAEACPDGDIQRASEMMTPENISKSQKFAAIFIAALNEGYENSMRYEDKDYVPNPITVDEIMCLDQDVFNDLITEAFGSFNDVKQTVEAVPKKNRAARRQE